MEVIDYVQAASEHVDHTLRVSFIWYMRMLLSAKVKHRGVRSCSHQYLTEGRKWIKRKWVLLQKGQNKEWGGICPME